MYAAPLNYDRFFRKVFSDVNIAKKFLEDFFDVIIEEIELLPTKYKITDAAAPVEFDFRCKINGQYVIIDMQQTYKPDVVKRFYIYQTLSACLQLETLPKKEVVSKKGNKYEVKSYEAILPTVTLIWMADDNLNFDLDSISFALLPEQLADFIKNTALWESKDFKKINAERKKLLTLLNNDAKELGFLPQNKLIFAFQKNIIKNPIFKEYKIWFEFAEATQNPKNKKQDFDKFKKNKTLMAVLERIKKDTLQGEEKTLLEEWEKSFIQLDEYRDYLENDLKPKIVEEAHQKGHQEGHQEGLQEGLQKGLQEARQEVEAEIHKEVDSSKETTVLLSFQQGLDISLIATITQLSVKKVKEIIKKSKGFLEK